MYQVVLLRHGESTWNKENRFTGWTDVDLTPAGEEEARRAGRVLHARGIDVDIAFTSVLTRAIRSLDIVLYGIGRAWIPVHKHWRLNERHYGALQGFNKATMAEREGRELVHAWRRSYSVRPPAIHETDERFPGHDPRYRAVPPAYLPRSESLEDTVNRFLPLWQMQIAPTIVDGARVLIVAHGNSLRALVTYLDNIADADVPDVIIPTGVPLVYELDADLRPIRHYYVDEEAASSASGHSGHSGTTATEAARG